MVTELAQCSGTVTVASELPTSGGDASIGGGTEKGIQLAVSQARARHLFGGCDINYLPRDDATVARGKHDPAQGARNIQELVDNRAGVVGVVGPFNSGVAVTELPISNAAGLTQISPSNTDPGLTIPNSDPDIDTSSLQPSRTITYYRVISNDINQAQVMAEFAFKAKGITKVYTLDDQETYGKDLANYFVTDFQKLGGTVVKHIGLPGNTRDFRPALMEARDLGAQGVFFGGNASNGSGLISKQMKEIGLNATFLSGDGSVDPQYFIDGGVSGDGTTNVAFASSAPDATSLDSAKAFNDIYKRTFSQDPIAYSAYGYDSMNILLDAVRQVLLANGGVIPVSISQFRTKVAAQVGKANWKGAIGATSFDVRGDTSNTSFTIYSATGGSWVGLTTVSAHPS